MKATLPLLGFWASLAWPATHLLDSNYEEFQKAGFEGVSQVAYLCLGLGVAGTLILLGLAKVLGSGTRALLFTTATLLSLAFFKYSVLHGFLATTLTDAGLTAGAGAGYLALIVAVLVVTWMLRHARELHVAVAVFAIAAAAVPMLFVVPKAIGPTPPAVRAQAPPEPVPQSAAGRVFENVYYVIVDGYVGDRNLAAVFDLHIDDFVDAMATRDFYYVEHSRSNYVGSASSIGSLFHMRYFRDVDTTRQPPSPRDYFPEVMNRTPPAPLVATLRERGYTLAFSQSWYSGCKDRYFRCVHRPSPFALTRESQLVAQGTPLSRLVPALFRKHVDAMSVVDRATIDTLLDEDRPTFLFVHHMQPHSPWYFDRSCNAMATQGRSDRDLYRESVLCVNRTTLAFVDRILDADPDALIVVHSDHGMGLTAAEQVPGVEEHAWPAAAMDERSETIALVRAPEACRRWLRPDIGPVNTMRFVLACLNRVAPEYLPERLLVPGPDYGRTNMLVEYTGFQ